jgi:excinuclease UvrABC nuclease subunit
MSATYVYELKDARGDVIYVGHTIDPFRRVVEHQRQDWGGRIARMSVSVYQHKVDALEVERLLIEDYEPEFNGQGRCDCIAHLLNEASA